MASLDPTENHQPSIEDDIAIRIDTTLDAHTGRKQLLMYLLTHLRYHCTIQIQSNSIQHIY